MSRRCTNSDIDIFLIKNNRLIKRVDDYVNDRTKINWFCLICCDTWEAIPSAIKYGNGCPNCANNKKLKNKDIDNFLFNKNIKRLDDYKNSETIMNWQCLNCENIWQTTSDSLRQGSGCPECNNKKLTNEEIDTIVNKRNIKRLDNYINSYTKLNWQCLICDYIWLATSDKVAKSENSKIEYTGCPNCARNRNEKIVGETLKLLNVETEKLRIDLDCGKKLFPDFYIPKLPLIIEYNGIQHYQPIQFGSMNYNDAKKSFINQEYRDNLLRTYCSNNNISLLEIDGRKYKGNNLKNYILDYFNQ